MANNRRRKVRREASAVVVARKPPLPYTRLLTQRRSFRIAQPGSRALRAMGGHRRGSGGTRCRRRIRQARAATIPRAARPARRRFRERPTAIGAVFVFQGRAVRTIFTVRASRATQYQGQNRAVLEDVWITLYGRDGSRNDNIHTRECSYDRIGAVHCEGEVQIDMASAHPAPGHSADTLQIKTSNLSFNRNTGEASTPAPVEFHFTGGQGSGVGVSYSTSDSIVRLEQNVAIRARRIGTDWRHARQRNGKQPRTAPRRSHRSAERPRDFAGRRARADRRQFFGRARPGQPRAPRRCRRPSADSRTEGGGKIAVAADRFEAILNPAGWVDHVTANGNIVGTRQTAAGTERFSAGHTDFVMVPQNNLIRDMTATGGVTAESHQGVDSRVLKTEALRVKFSRPATSGERRVPAKHPEKPISKISKAPKPWRPPQSKRTAQTIRQRMQRQTIRRAAGRQQAISTSCSDIRRSQFAVRSAPPIRRIFQPTS